MSVTMEPKVDALVKLGEHCGLFGHAGAVTHGPGA